MSAPVDAAVRLQALDPVTSFIVQAPAGSGKTELLTRRVLTLLATVDEPEEILAITFTRKAASEMRQRVVETLQRAQNGLVPDNDYEAEGLALAQSVLDRDKQLDWQLVRNPQRLNLRTIDALATQLAHRLPVTSALGAPTGVIENAAGLYRDVAGRFIESHLGEMQLVLLQLGNRLEQAQGLLANLLANRDQWKRHVYDAGTDHDQLRQVLESMLADLVESRLDNLYACVPEELAEALPARLRVAFEFLLQDCEGDIDEIDSDMQAWFDMEELPGCELSDLQGWDSIGKALLTTKPEVRKSVTKAIGFPAKSDAKKRGVDASLLESHKQDMVAILDCVREAPEFVDALIEVCSLPYPRYGDDQWQLLSELLSVLPDLLLELQLAFSERGVVDFAELSERAQRALGTEDEPTDLALSMDLSLKHVLVDEFQDTSQTQFRLFEQLVRGWSEGDGRTFFVVGDPMQSIYRFREGDVALFGQARQNGVGDVRLKPLALSVNFRAAPAVVDWVNDSFANIFPVREDPDIGAVPYSPSSAHLKTEGSVTVHPLIDVEKVDEAALVADIAKQAIADNDAHRVAILVRTRGQAAEIFAALRAAQLSYQSIDMDLVGERSVVKDLVSLCLAMRYPHDRLHWLSLLRAPFVGLSLNDLHALMDEGGSKAAVVELLRETDRVAKLSVDAQTRIARLMSILEPALKRVSRSHLMPWVESVWLQLGGPAVCRDDIDANAAERAIERLVSLEANGLLWQKSVMDEAMKSLYAQQADDSGCQIQIMTLHKSKGLEFDTVILPALDRQPRADGTQLLNWFESTLDGRPQLLLAPFEQSGLHAGQRERLNRLVRKARERCDAQEKLRLLYVACTRTCQHLHVIARVANNSEGDLRTPIKASLLNPLWPIVGDTVAAANVANVANAANTANTANTANVADVADAADAIDVADAIDSGHAGNVVDTAETATTDIPALSESSEAAAQLVLDASPIPAFDRLPLNAVHPHFNHYQWLNDAGDATDQMDSVEFSWAGREARDVGTVVHQQLQSLADGELLAENLDIALIETVARRQLRNLGVQSHNLDAMCAKVLRAIENTVADERGRWLLLPHQDARSEWALSVPRDGASSDTHQNSEVDPQASLFAPEFPGIQKIIIDRTFVDEHGTRWIVDFKTGDHAGGQADEFLDKEQERYADQLNRYADIMRRLEQRPIRVGLYFPMLKGWREWEPAAAIV